MSSLITLLSYAEVHFDPNTNIYWNESMKLVIIMLVEQQHPVLLGVLPTGCIKILAAANTTVILEARII